MHVVRPLRHHRAAYATAARELHLWLLQGLAWVATRVRLPRILRLDFQDEMRNARRNMRDALEKFDKVAKYALARLPKLRVAPDAVVKVLALVIALSTSALAPAAEDADTSGLSKVERGPMARTVYRVQRKTLAESGVTTARRDVGPRSNSPRPPQCAAAAPFLLAASSDFERARMLSSSTPTEKAIAK